MTNKTPKILHEITPGEYVDINTAFDRHPALHGIQLEADTESTRVSSAKTGKTKTVHTVVGYGLWMSPAMFSALVKILNAAPVNGDPLNAIVSLDIDTTASIYAREKIARYLADNGYEATLENVAAAILYSGADTPYAKITLPYGKYCIARISRIEQEANTTGAATFALTKLTVPGGWSDKVNVTFDFPSADISYVEGEENKKVNARVLRYYEPGKNTALGGILMERITD